MWEQGTGWIPDPPDQRDYGRAPTYLPASFARSGLQEQIVAPAALPPRVRASLTSDWWALVRADYHCERCGFHGTDETLNVHHRHYRCWHERSEDLEVLCRPCHGHEHDLPIGQLVADP